ncbi:uncharacterized protein DUF616 [Novosphingobium sp. PhB55]|uniref:glycoside hydrolase family 99-like domain-containing protein n=1 Tax=Novosphingobium sp. PhB55 TaxID=2485106 RepID=UPI001065BA6B|nr:glycoside hydrolase family 99-like domain-containing protein [Novosphingobium sp. PhB55]TDW59237.1 uncharacterized protein DUF616 [Novosphingobium sp. PhB55]
MNRSIDEKSRQILLERKLFDPDWYRSEYTDVTMLEMDPLEHFIAFGARLLRRPSPTFDVQKLRSTDDVLGLLMEEATRVDTGLAARSDINSPVMPNRSRSHPAPAFEFHTEHRSQANGPAVELHPGSISDIAFEGTLAVHVHLFYVDMLAEIKCWLSSIPVPFDLYVSVATEEIQLLLQDVFDDIASLNRSAVEVHPNRGRDIAPLVVGFGPRIAKYDYVVHFHSKKSDHTVGKRDWGTHLGHHLFHSADYTSQVLNLFASQKDLGLIFPIYHDSVKGQIKWGANLSRADAELRRLCSGQNLVEGDLLPFPAGSFFLARVEAIRPLLEGGFKLEDFEVEQGQVDGTLAHAIERLFVLIADRRGFTFKQVMATKPHSLGRSYLDDGCIYRSEMLERVRRGGRVPAPVYSAPALQGLRIRFYTCSTGGYDEPLPFEAFVEGADYHFYSDLESESELAQWTIRPLALSDPHPVKAARRHKSQPHDIFDDVDIAVWIDGNIALSGDVSGLIAKVIENNAAFGVIPHPYRSKVSDELAMLCRVGLDDPRVMNAQYERYRKQGFEDDQGLTETNFLVMDLRRSETRAALDVWWSEIKQGSRRDQLSFDYSCWKVGAKKVSLITNGLSARADPRFAYFSHGGKSHPGLDMRARLSNLWFSRHVAPDEDRHLSNSLRVDVVVCVHNSPDDVARCLRALALNRDGRTRIVIVDDGSASPTQAVVARHLQKNPSDLHVRHEEAKGYTKAANAGLRASDGDYVVLLNSDTIVPQGWVGSLVDAGEADPDVGIVGPLSNAASWQSVPETLQASGDLAINRVPEGMCIDELAEICGRLPAKPVYRCSVVNGFCFAIKRKVIDAIGYLDEAAFPQGYGEENDYCFRAGEAGMTCGFTLSTYVYHAKSKSFNHERRKVLSQQGWNVLVERYGKERLGKIVEEMKCHPALEMARRWFKSQTCRMQPKAKAIGLYLPQFHSFSFNDTVWGAGFTEWRNVVKAKPRFDEHIQPLLPGELGFYDLRTPETLAAQARLAFKHGLSGMAVYYYRFGRERLMSAPTDRLLSVPGAKLNFFYCWANEDWTRAWDGQTSDVLLKQDYSDETLKLLVEDLIDACADTRYIRISDRPVLMIYQLNRLPNAKAAIDRIRALVRESLSVDPMIGTTWNNEFRDEWEALVDFIVQFPPHRTPRVSKRTLLNRNLVPGARENTADHLESYDLVVEQSIEAMDVYDALAPGVCPAWDNSPRRARSANILIGSTPNKFAKWTANASVKAVDKFKEGKLPAPLLFVNAWNEWAEGAVLEPSERYGRAYLRALYEGLA